jgi:primary-amine oxidase
MRLSPIFSTALLASILITSCKCDPQRIHKEIENSHPHPLDPLRPQEILMTKSVILHTKSDILPPGPYFFNLITLVEPPKSVLLPYFIESPPPGIFPRKSYTLLHDRNEHKSYEVTVNLDSLRVENVSPVTSEAMLSFVAIEELINIEERVLSDPRVLERCTKLGYNNVSLIQADVWPYGYRKDDMSYKYPGHKSEGLLQVFMYGKSFNGDNYQGELIVNTRFL